MSNNTSYPIQNISFFTNCYEGDWKRILQEERLEQMIERCNVNFAERALIINNIKDRNLVAQYAQQALEKGIIDAYYFSEDYTDEVLSAFSITRGSFRLDFYDDFWYSMGPLSAVYLCKSKYLLYFTCDCMLADDKASDWISSAIEKFHDDSRILIANPVWNNNINEARSECFEEDDNWFYSRSFSDQCFFVEKARLHGNVYNFYHTFSERYPLYAGNLFEKRVDSYIQSKQLIRITHKRAFYVHEKLVNDDLIDAKDKQSVRKLIRERAGKFSKQLRIFFGLK